MRGAEIPLTAFSLSLNKRNPTLHKICAKSALGMTSQEFEDFTNGVKLWQRYGEGRAFPFRETVDVSSERDFRILDFDRLLFQLRVYRNPRASA